MILVVRRTLFPIKRYEWVLGHEDAIITGGHSFTIWGARITGRLVLAKYKRYLRNNIKPEDIAFEEKIF